MELNLADKILSLPINRSASAALDALFRQIDPQLQAMNALLGDIHNSIERQQAMWLRSALTFLRLGEYRQAREELVRASASDPRGAVSRFFLGLLLLKEGNGSFAKEQLEESLAINPFLLTWVFNELKAIKPESLLNAQTPSQKHAWSIHVSTKDSGRKFKTRDSDSIWSIWLGERHPQEALCAMSVGSNNLVASWLLSPNFEYWLSSKDDAHLISSFDLGTGLCRWTKELGSRRLLFSTSRYVILGSDDNTRSYSFLSVSDGSLAGEMSHEYFATIFCPTLEIIMASQDYKCSTHSFQSLDQAKRWLHECEKKPTSFLGSIALDVEENHFLEDAGTVRNAWESTIRITASNHWRYYIGRAARHTSYRMYCTAKVNRTE